MSISGLLLYAALGCTVLGQRDPYSNENGDDIAETVGPILNADSSYSQKEPFRLYPICNANFTSCLVHACQARVDILHQCIYCPCGPFMDDLSIPPRSVMMDLGLTLLNLTAIGDDFELPHGIRMTLGNKMPDKMPYIVRNINKVKDKPMAEAQGLKQALVKLSLSDNFIGLPVAIAMPGEPFTEYVDSKFSKSKGLVMNLPFLNSSLQTNAIIAEFYDDCVEDAMTDGINERGHVVYQLHHQYFDIYALLQNSKIYDSFAKIARQIDPHSQPYECLMKSTWHLSRSQYMLLAIVRRLSDALNRSADNVDKLHSDLKSAEDDSRLTQDDGSSDLLTMMKLLSRIAQMNDSVRMRDEISRIDATRLYRMAASDFAESLRKREGFLKDLVDNLAFLDEMEPFSPENCVQSMLFDRVQKFLWMPKQNGSIEEMLGIIMNETIAMIPDLQQFDRICNASHSLLRASNLPDITYDITNHSLRSVNISNVRMNIYELLLRSESILDFLHDESKPIDKIVNLLSKRPIKPNNTQFIALRKSHQFVVTLKEIGLGDPHDMPRHNMSFGDSTHPDNVLSDLTIAVQSNKHSKDLHVLKNFTKIVEHALQMYKTESRYDALPVGCNGSNWLKEHLGPNKVEHGYNSNRSLIKSWERLKTVTKRYASLWHITSGSYPNISYAMRKHLDNTSYVMGCPMWNTYEEPTSRSHYSSSRPQMSFCEMNLIKTLVRLDFHTVMQGIERSVCNKSMDFGGDEDDERINMTLKYIRDITKYYGNKTLEDMRKRLKEAGPSISKDEYTFMTQLITNMTNLNGDEESKIATAKGMVNEISDFKMNMPTSNLYNVSGIEGIVSFIAHVTTFDDQLKMLCKIARNHGALKDRNASFGNVIMNSTALSKLVHFLDNNVTATVSKFRNFLTTMNLTVSDGISMANFTELVRTTAWSLIHGPHEGVDEFQRNLSKIIHHVRRLNSTQNRMCLKSFKNLPERSTMNPKDVSAAACVFEIVTPFFAGKSPFSDLYRTLKNIEMRIRMFQKEYHYTYKTFNESVVYSCYPRSVYGLLMGDASMKNSTSRTAEIPVRFKHYRGAMMSTKPMAVKKPLMGVLWINVPRNFDVNQIFEGPFKNHTTISGFSFPKTVPVLPNDKIPEIFVDAGEDGVISTQSLFKDQHFDVLKVLIKKGKWTVRDSNNKTYTKAESLRTKRQVNEDACGDHIPSGWRCLHHQDTISPDATLKLLPDRDTGISVGIIAVFPLNESRTAAGVIQAKNLIVTRLSTNASRNATISSVVEIPIMVIAGKEYIFKIAYAMERASHNTDLDLLRQFTGLGNVDKILERFEKAMIRQFVRVEGIQETIANRIDVSYRANVSADWRIFQPQMGFYLLRTSELRISANLDTPNKTYELKMYLESAKSFKIMLQVYSPPQVLTMLVPQDFHLPSIPFDISKYRGFVVSSVVRELTSLLQKSYNLIGIAIHKIERSSIGTWQILCSSCREWLDIEHVKSKWTSERDTAVKGVVCNSEDVILLSPMTRLRFYPHKFTTFWKTATAWVDSTITISLYRIIKNMTETEELHAALLEEGFTHVSGSYLYNEECQDQDITDFSTLLTSVRRFAIERLGCDGRRSSVKTYFDQCGICGGSGKSCVDCSGKVNGTAIYDRCERCVNGTTGRKPTKLDCGSSCYNENYLDECGFCQKRNMKKRDFRDCNGTCFGSAVLDKCGACRTRDGVLVHLPDEAMIVDACGECGGRNATCAGCDMIPNSGKILDECGKCMMPSDPSFNKGCGKIFYIRRVFPPLLVLRNMEDKAHIIIDGYFNTQEEVSCNLRHAATDTILDIGRHKVMKLNSKSTDAVHSLGKVMLKLKNLLPEGVTFAKWNLTCEIDSDRATFKSPIFVRTTNPWGLLSIEPKAFAVSDGGGSVTIAAKEFPEATDLMCVGVYFSKDTLYQAQEHVATLSSSFLKTTRAFKVGAVKIDTKTVRCEFPNSSLPVSVNAYVLSKMEVESFNPTSMARSVTGGLSFQYRDKAPSVKEARISNDLNFIWIVFDVDVRVVNDAIKTAKDLCKFAIMESNIVGTTPLCFMRGMRNLLIRPGKTAAIPVAISRSSGEVIGTIVLKEKAFQGHGATEPLPRTEVQLHMPHVEVLPKVYLHIPDEAEPCESVKMDVGVLEGVGAWKFRYEWTVNGFTNNKQAIIDMLNKASSDKRRAVLKWNNAVGMMLPGGNYTISVSATNAFGKRGPDATATITVKGQNAPLRVYIIGSNEKVVRSASNLNLKAYARIMKPKCRGQNRNESLSAQSAKDMLIKYVWEARDEKGATIDLENVGNRKLTVPRGLLKPGVYRFKVTGLYFKDREPISAIAMATVKVVSSQVIAKILGPKSRLVTTGDDLIVDGSRSVDPDGGTITYKWTCEEFETEVPCSVKSTDGTGMERADSIFPNYQKEGVLSFPGKLLTPGIVVKITLTIQSGNRTASDKVFIFIVDESSHLPSISFSRAKDLLKDSVPVNKVVRLTADLIGNNMKNWTMSLKWSCVEEEGYSCVDLTSASHTVIEDREEIKAGQRAHFSLVIKKNVLQPGSAYKFRLQATPDRVIHPLGEGEEDIVIYADVQIKTSRIATGGSLKFSPSNGSALTTEFILSAEDWLINDDKSDTIFYRFAYMSQATFDIDRSRMTYLGPFSDRPEITTVLPAGLRKKNDALSVILLIRIGENDDSIQKAVVSIPVYPMMVEDDVIDDIKSQAAQALISGNRDETVANILLLQGVVQSNSTKREVKDLADQTMKKMEAFDPTTEREAGDALDDARNLLSSFGQTMPLSEESKEISLRLVEVTLTKLYKKDAQSSSRRKRSVQEEGSDISEAMAEKILEVFDTVLSSGSSSDLLHQTRAKFEEDSEFIMSSFCSYVGFDEPAKSVDTGFSLIAVKKVTMPTSNSFGQGTHSFTLSNAVQNQFSNWDCDEGTAACLGACVSYGFYDGDVINTDENMAEFLGDRISPITAVFIRNPTDGAIVRSSSSSDVEQLVIEYVNITLQAGVDRNSIQCRHRSAAEIWESSSCDAYVDPSTSKISCTCDVSYGYFALFASIKPTESTMQMTSVLSSTMEEIFCPVNMKVAETCDELQLCARDAMCEIGKTCVCIHSASGSSSDQCVETCPTSDVISATTESKNLSTPPSNRMTAGAIIGLVVALVVVTVVLLLLVKHYYMKAKGRITPTNSRTHLNTPPPEYEADETETSIPKKAEPNEYEMAPMPSAPPSYSQEPPMKNEEV